VALRVDLPEYADLANPIGARTFRPDPVREAAIDQSQGRGAMRRVPELDALRGIAAVMVLSLHLGLGTPYALLASAVDMFFVLSG
jgi:hypothetical protein